MIARILVVKLPNDFINLTNTYPASNALQLKY